MRKICFKEKTYALFVLNLISRKPNPKLLTLKTLTLTITNPKQTITNPKLHLN